MYVPRAMYSLSMSFWIVPASAVAGTALRFGHRDVEREQDGGRRVDRHRRRDLVEREALEQRSMSSTVEIGDADRPTSPARERWSES